MAAVAVLIITCPCALGLAVPAVQVVASGNLFRKGIMIKDGAALEKLAAIDTVIFDKTGTLTRGKPELVSPLMVSTDTLAMAAGLAQSSKHPLSQALVREVTRRGLAAAEVTDIAEHPGLGLSGTWRGEAIRLGSRAWCGMEESEADRGLLEFAFRRGQRPAVLFQFEDQLRPDAEETIAALKRMGLDVHMLSGDREAAVTRAAGLVGIETAVSRASPQVKLAYVDALSKAGRKVLMVGDGINDAPALARADVGIAMGSGTDVAMEAADVTILRGDLRSVVTAVLLSRRTIRIIMENLGWAFGYNVVLIPVAAGALYPLWGILLSPILAGLAMALSSVSVVTNSLRLRRFRPGPP
jgi:heavy metal translocating P-type ATPase